MTALSDRYLSTSDVLSLVPFSRATLYRKVEDGTFPKQVPISTGRVAWRQSDIDSWLANPADWSHAA